MRLRKVIYVSGLDSNLADGRRSEATAALYGLRPTVVRAVLTAVGDGDQERVRGLLYPLHPSDQADLIEQLDHDERQFVVAAIRDDFRPEILSELDETVREEIVDSLGVSQVASAVSELESDDAVEVIEDLDEATQRRVLAAMPVKERETVEEGLAYPDDSAGRLMQREVFAIPANWTVGQTVDHIREAADLPDDIHEIYAVDSDGRPVGSVPFHKLLRERRPARITSVMRGDIETISASTDQEDVAKLFRDHDLFSAPVVDDDGRLLGLITADDVMDVIDEEAEEDMLRMAGLLRDDLYRAAFATARSRFSWLAVNLLTAILASVVIAFFEATIDQIVALAVLMPIVASMGGNAGTQTMTVAVRALAMRELGPENSLRFVGKELLVGLINGVLFSVLIAAVAGLWFASAALGLVIAVAMVFNLIVAGLSGTLIPLGLQRAGIDPAVASTVLLTTVTDVIGFLAFLGLGALILL